VKLRNDRSHSDVNSMDVCQFPPVEIVAVYIVGHAVVVVVVVVAVVHVGVLVFVDLVFAIVAAHVPAILPRPHFQGCACNPFDNHLVYPQFQLTPLTAVRSAERHSRS